MDLSRFVVLMNWFCSFKVEEWLGGGWGEGPGGENDCERGGGTYVCVGITEISVYLVVFDEVIGKEIVSIKDWFYNAANLCELLFGQR